MAHLSFCVSYYKEYFEYTVLVPELDMIIISVHVVINDVIPDPPAD